LLNCRSIRSCLAQPNLGRLRGDLGCPRVDLGPRDRTYRMVDHHWTQALHANRAAGKFGLSDEFGRNNCDRWAASAGSFHPHVPFDEPPDLPFGIAVLQHPSDEIVVFLFGLAVLLRPE